MIVNRNYLATIQATEGAVFTIVGQNANGITVFLQNRSTVNFIQYRFQSGNSNVDSAFTDLVDGSGNDGTSGIIAAGEQAMVNIRSTDAFIRMLASASGGALLESNITQFAPDSSSMFNAGTI